VLFLIWLYVSWLVLLFGADVAFYLQHPEYLYAMPGEPRLSNRMRERLALAVMQLVGSHFVQGRPPWTLYRLTQRLAVPMHSVEGAVRALIAGALLKETRDDPPLPARDLAEMSVAACSRPCAPRGRRLPPPGAASHPRSRTSRRASSAVTRAGRRRTRWSTRRARDAAPKPAGLSEIEFVARRTAIRASARLHPPHGDGADQHLGQRSVSGRRGNYVAGHEPELAAWRQHDG
jgi:hypothetical protein